ncbi:carboxymuconolactone decarboxylase family protein [Porifericola rhodea]|uniref:carboxymuconolactone decarboxylase family protein n=1 Tax=Porifericola rhodea TaxID=930972 RepID=UPI002665E2D5|nr:carboxymuconolactone decarboxylase family protein [Porifericola rhodea]WKN32961.1 carboxymuconolactone decarboxylase family protein [Porifericola rhodea]
MKSTQRFSIIEYNKANSEVITINNDTMREMGIPCVHNWFKCQGNNATLFRGNREKLKSSLLQEGVPFILKQLIIFNISQKKGCIYCAHAHRLMEDSMSKTLTDQEGFKVSEHSGSDYIPSAYNTAIRIVTKAALDPASTTHNDFEELRDVGYTDHEIQELMNLADLTSMHNTTADISGIKINNELMETK